MLRLNRVPGLVLLLTLSWAPLVGSVRADVRLPHVLSDHMVLQRDRPIPIWGWATPGEEVTVTLGESNSAKDQADEKGNWRVDLAAMPAGGPHKLSVTGKNTISVQNVLVGEVWLCAGQSNMQWKVSQTPTGGQDLAKSEDPLFRLCNAFGSVATTPQSDGPATWAVSGPGSVGSFSAVAYYFGKHLREKLNVPVGLINVSAGAIPIEAFTPTQGFQLVPSQSAFVRLVDQVRGDIRRGRETSLEHWVEQSRAAIAADAPLPPLPPVNDVIAQRGWMPTGVFNGSINPLIHFGIRGVVFYQGEANNGQGMEYFEKMQALIGSWRKLWGQGDFPFLFVQLAPWAKYPEGNLEGIWEAQVAALTIPNTGMAVTTDLVPDINDIHPPRKKEVGDRLARWALATIYGQDQLVYSGPLYKSSTIMGNKIRVQFDHIGSGLAARDDKPLSHFQIGTTDGFVDAEATIDGDAILVSSSQISKPQFVRFGWKNNAQPNLINKEGLPASPFRTDCAAVTFSTGSSFTDRKRVQLYAQGMPGVIRYTLDGSTPNKQSPIYSKPLDLEKTTTIRARLFADDGRSSLINQATYTKTDPVAFNGKTLGPGLNYEYYVGRWVEMPDLTALKAERTATLDRLKPTVFSESFMCAHRFHGYLLIPQAGQYTFQLIERGRLLPGSAPRARLSIDGHPVPRVQPALSKNSSQPVSLATGRTVRVRLEGEQQILTLAEVQIFEAITNLPLQTTGKASQSSTGYGCTANRASDGNTNPSFFGGSISSTDTEKNPWWSLDLGSDKSIGQIKVVNRADCCGERLSKAVVEVLDAAGKVVWSTRIGMVESGSIDEFTAGESITLSAGMHPFEVTYLETGAPALTLFYEGPGIERQEVPAQAFFREE